MISGLKELFRWRPVLAWAMSGTLLGCSVAIYECGLGLNWLYLFLALMGIILIQAFLAHTANDLIDEEVDRKAPIKKTGRTKVLIDGIMSRRDLILVGLVSLLIVLALILFFTIKLGPVIILLAAVGVYSALAYSLPPLKLGYRPFAEFTVVLPVLTVLVVGINFVVTGSLSLLAFFVGLTFAFANIVWFIISRAQDVDADEEAGKNTTAVLLRKKDLDLLWYCTYLVVILMLVSFLPWWIQWFQIPVIIMGIIYILIFVGMNVEDVTSIALARTRSIFLVSGWSLVTSVIFIIGGLL